MHVFQMLTSSILTSNRPYTTTSQLVQKSSHHNVTNNWAISDVTNADVTNGPVVSCCDIVVTCFCMWSVLELLVSGPRCYECHFVPPGVTYRHPPNTKAGGGIAGYDSCALLTDEDRERVNTWRCGSGRCFLRQDSNGCRSPRD